MLAKPAPDPEKISSGKPYPASTTIAGPDWRKALAWLIAELLVIKLVFLVCIKILFFSVPNHSLTTRDVEARLFPAGRGQISAVTKEKSHD